MSAIVPIAEVEAILFGLLKLTWADGHAAVVDLRPVIAERPLLSFLRECPERFDAVQREAHGHYVFWLDEQGDEIEFGSDSLRKRAERQAEILRRAS